MSSNGAQRLQARESVNPTEVGLGLGTTTDDYSRNFAELRTKLVGADGQRYVLFVRSLRPDYATVYRDIAIGYTFLFGTLILTAVSTAAGLHPLAASVCGAIAIGYWVAYLSLFLHEAAHYNLAASKKRNDRLCDLFISWLVGASVGDYRSVHFQHHRELGTPHDSEFTYFFPLNLMFLFKAATGIRVVEVLLDRRNNKSSAPAASSPKGSPLGAALIGLAVHASIVFVCFVSGAWWAAIAWLLGIGVFFPFFGALRQLLEHRDDHATAELNYKQTAHGAFTRLFGDGFFDDVRRCRFQQAPVTSLGATGFYTNLKELERFLEGTMMNDVMQRRRSSYLATFQTLFSLS